MTNPETRLAELVAEVSDEIIPTAAENLRSGVECEVCSAGEVTVEMKGSTTRIEEFNLACPARRCDGQLSVTEVIVQTGGDIPVSLSEYVRVNCTDCGDGPRAMEDALKDEEPADIVDYDIPIPQLERSTLHEHHVSYVPEETVLVCSSCHAKIHHDEQFRPELTPERKKSEVQVIDG